MQATFELDVVRVDQSEDGSGLTGDLQRGGSVRAVSTQHKTCGKLHLRIANIGHTVESKKVAGECVDVILGWGGGGGALPYCKARPRPVQGSCHNDCPVLLW